MTGCVNLLKAMLNGEFSLAAMADGVRGHAVRVPPRLHRPRLAPRPHRSHLGEDFIHWVVISLLQAKRVRLYE